MSTTFEQNTDLLSNELLRVSISPIGVDMDAKVIRGAILAEIGHFKSHGRGQFTEESLQAIEQLASELPDVGLHSRLDHPTASNNGIGRFLGRVKNIRRDGDKIRGDIHIDKTALSTNISGGTPIGEYVLQLAQSDPQALETSFRLSAKRIHVGSGQPPVWIPTKLGGSDVVESGDAVKNGLLSSDNAAQELKKIIADLSAEQHQKLQTIIRGENDMANQTPTAPVISDEQLGKIIDGVTEKIGEQFGEKIDGIQKVTESLGNEQKAKLLENRAASITAICTDAGCAEKASEFIANANLSVDQVRATLWDDFKAKRPLPKADAGNKGGNGGSGDEDKLATKFGKEYDEQAEFLSSSFGLTREGYIESRKKDEKPAPSTNPLIADK